MSKGGSLRAIQTQELEILVEFRRICEENKLKYYITAGTLLGAVRHKGFIPWDDDIDVAMPIRDYKKFARICRRTLSGSFFLQNTASDRQYPFYFCKIRKNSTFVNDPFLKNLAIHKGLYIDIFPLVKCPENERAARTYFKLVEFITYAIIAKYDREFVCGYGKRAVKLIFNLIKLLPKKVLVLFRNTICQTMEILCSGKRLCTVSGAHGYPREAYDSEWFSRTAQLVFEGEVFCAPSGWDELLTSMYGNYMTPPPADDCAGHFI